jgi:hypothetical protein
MAQWNEGFMRDFGAVYEFNVIERNKIWKEYMEVEEEEGKRELTGRCRSGSSSRT